MAWARSALAAADVTYAASDKPLLGGSHALENATNIKWRTSGSYAAGADDNDPLYPPARACDRGADARTRPATAAATHYLLFDCSAAPVTIDTFALIGHNLYTVGASVDLQIADNNAFSVNLVTLATFLYGVTFFDNSRQVELAIDHGGADYYQYTGVPYVRLRFTTGAAAVKAEVGEAWPFQRRQMMHWPQHPWTPSHRGQGEVAEFVTEGGVVHPYAKHSGRADIDMAMRFANVADGAALRSFIGDTSHGSLPAIILPQPNTSVQDARIMTMGPGGISAPNTRATTIHEYRMSFRESAPFVSSEGL